MTTNAELKRLAEAIGGETWQVYQHAATPSPTLYDVVGATRDDDVAECLPFRRATYIAAANPARIIALVDECEKHERTITRLNKQASTSRTFWLRAARAALNGDLRELRNRVDMADAPPVDVVLSLTNGEGE